MTEMLQNVATSVFSWILVSIIAAAVSAVVATMMMRSRVTTLEKRADLHDASLKDQSNRIQKIEVSCPNNRMNLVSKSEIVTITGSINALGERLSSEIAEADKHNEDRISDVHDRVNDLQQHVGTLSGQLTEHTKGHCHVSQ